VGLCQLVPAQTRLEVGSDRHQRAHSASCATVMVWISARWQYTLSTSSAVGAGEAFKGLAAVASVKPPLTVGRGGHSLSSSLGGSKIHH
jgi:hypothetical protein